MRSLNLPVDLPRRALYLSGGILALSVSYFMITPLLALYLSTELHSSPGRIGIVLSIMGLANQGLQVFIGAGSVRWGNRKLLSVGVTVACIGYIGFAVGRSFASQLICAFTLGLGNATISLVAKAMLAEQAAGKQTAAFALRSIAVNAGAAIGPIIGGLLFDRFQAVLLAATAINILFWLAIVRIARQDADERSEQREFRGQVPKILGNPALVGLTCASIGFWYLYTQLTFTFPLYANHRFDLAGRVGPLFAVSAVIAVTLQYPAIMWFKRRVGSWTVLAIGSSILASAFLILGLVPTAWALLFFIVIFSLGELLVVPTLDILTVEVSSAESVAGSFGFTSLGWAAGGLLGNLGGGMLYQVATRSGLLSLFWMFNAMIGGVTALAFLLFRYHFQARSRPDIGLAPVASPARRSSEGNMTKKTSFAKASTNAADYLFTHAPAVPYGQAATWDALVPGTVPGFYLCHDWLESIRGSEGYEDSTWRIVNSDQCIVGSIPVYTIAGPVGNPLYDLFSQFGNISGADASDKAAWSPQALIGSRAGYANTPIIQDPSILPAWAIAASRAVAASNCGSAAIPYLDLDTTMILRQFFPGRPMLLSGGRCQVSLKGGDFEDYLAALPGSRRAIVRRDLRSFARSGDSIRIQQLETEMIGSLAPLLANVQRNHGSAVSDQHVADYLHRCSAGGLKKHSVVFTCYQENEIVGFSLGYHFGSSLIMRVVGLDYPRVSQNGGYFSLLMHEPIRYACQKGLASVDLGIEGYRTKLLRGADFEPLWSLLLASPLDWKPAASDAHNDMMARKWAASFGDIVPDLMSRCGR